MAFSNKAGTFNKIGTVASQAVTGVGFQPKAVLFFSSYQSGSFNVLAENTWLTYAITDGTTTFGRSSVMNNYNAGPGAGGTVGFSYQANAIPVIGITGGNTPTLKALAAVTSLDVDGFTLNWTTNDGATPAFFYLAIGGTDITGAKVLAFTPHGRVGQQSVSGMGFRPSVVMFFPGFSATFPVTDSVSAHHGFGVGVSAAEQWAVSGWQKGTGARPAYTTRYQRDDRCLVIQPEIVITASDSFFDGTDRTFEAEASFVSRDIDGFTIDWQQAESGRTVYVLGLKGGRYKAGSFLSLQGSQAQAITRLMFQPSFLLMASDGRHEEILSLSTPVIEAKLSLGVATAAGQYCVSMHDQDGAGRTSLGTYPVNARVMSNDSVAKVIEAAAPLAAATVLTYAQVAAFTADGFTLQWVAATAMRRQFLYLVGGALSLAAACSGGGAGPTITDPPGTDVSIATATTPLLFVEIAFDGGTRRYAQVPLADASSYYGGYKEGRVVSVSAIQRALSSADGGFSTSTCQVTLDDADRALRTLEAAGTLMNRRVDVYVTDDADRRAGNPARRMGSFLIRRWKALSDLQFSLELEDWFGSQLGEFNLNKLIPQNTFTKSIFSGLPDALVGTPEPVGYGSLSDEDQGVDAIGVVPVYFTGQEVVNGFAWDRYVVFGHAIKSIQSWFASDLGQNPTGQPRRVKMAAGTEGVDFLIPGNAGWLAHTGSATVYRTFGGRRYTVIYARGPRSDAHKTGGLQITLNVCGIETVGDGSGTMLDGLHNQIWHCVNNQIAQTYLTGAWLSVPLINTYSELANLTAVNASAVARLAGGYKGAFILGGARGQITVEEFMRQASQSGDVQFGVNRHGQLAMSMEDTAVASVTALVDVTDIDAAGLEVEIGWDELANYVPYRYGPAYAAAAASGETVLPWLTDTFLQDGAAQTAHRQVKKSPALDMTLVRDTATADDNVAKVLARRTGGSAPYRGPVYAPVTGGLKLALLDLGDNVDVTHFAGLGAGGWTAQKARVVAVTFNPATWGLTLRVKAI